VGLQASGAWQEGQERVALFEEEGVVTEECWNSLEQMMDNKGLV